MGEYVENVIKHERDKKNALFFSLIRMKSHE